MKKQLNALTMERRLRAERLTRFATSKTEQQEETAPEQRIKGRRRKSHALHAAVVAATVASGAL